MKAVLAAAIRTTTVSLVKLVEVGPAELGWTVTCGPFARPVEDNVSLSLLQVLVVKQGGGVLTETGDL